MSPPYPQPAFSPACWMQRTLPLCLYRPPHPLCQPESPSYLFFCCCDKNTIAKINLGKKGLTEEYSCSPLRRKCLAGAQGRNLQAGTEWVPQRMLLTGLPFMACSVCCFIQPRTTFLGWHRPQWTEPSHIRKCLSDSPTDQSHRAILSIVVPSSQGCLDLCQADRKQSPWS